MAHRPRKRFSQNFLVDEGAIAAIVAAIAPQPDDLMVEVGPGLGALTRPLSRIVRQLHVVEIDRDLAARLRSDYPPERLVVHEGDALDFDFSTLGTAEVRVVGNLPYHISTPLLFAFAAQAAVIRDVHAMLQDEVVERIAATPGSSEYGRLSVMLQYYFHVEKVLDVAASSFRPEPNVESAVIRMTPRAGGVRARDNGLLSETVARAFGQRRKTLRNTLRGLLSEDDFARVGIDPALRAQDLTVDDFVRIADDRAGRKG